MIATGSLRPGFPDRALAARAVSVRPLVLGVFALLLVDQLLLLALLGQPGWLIGLAALACAVLCAALARAPGWATGEAAATVSPRGLALLFAFALGVFVLGGEGRLFYATTDWQVRLAVLNDLVSHPWPWAYATADGLTILRCPVGIYLLPALVGKAFGPYAAELALLVQDAALLAAVLALAAPLVPAGRARPVTLLLVAGSSGLDVLGQALYHNSVFAHLEGWAGLQYSAPVTLAFWVPQHALAGWIGAVAYLLWRANRLPLVALLALVPALPLLSPLSAIGVLPFVAVAGLETLLRGRLGWRDVALPALAVALAVPSLLYLAAGMGGVPTGAAHFRPLTYALFVVFEILPFLIVIALSRGSWALDRISVLLACAMIVVLPFGRVGESVDFMMRASIAPLTIVFLVMAGVLRAVPDAGQRDLQAARRIAIAVFAIGLAVPVGEIARAVLLHRAPRVVCGYYGVVPDGYSTYVAPFDRVPALIRPARPAITPITEPAVCWQGDWNTAGVPAFVSPAR